MYFKKRDRQIREALKYLITKYFNIHQQGDKKDIVILSSPRSGSTWLMNMLYSQPGIKYIDEPLNKYILDNNKNLFPIKSRWNYLNLSSEEKKFLKNYFIEDYPVKHFGPKNFFSKDYNFFTNRRVFKIIRANALIEWFSNDLNMQVVYLVRHPLAQSLSCQRRGHNLFFKTRQKVFDKPEYLIDEEFLRSNLNNIQREEMCKIYDKGNELNKFLLEWCLDNMFLIKKNSVNNNWLSLTYEELVIDPHKTLNLLYKKLALTDKNRFLSQLAAPSKTSDSSTKKTKESIKRKDTTFLLNKWKNQLSSREMKESYKIMEVFGIDLYRPDKAMPSYSLGYKINL